MDDYLQQDQAWKLKNELMLARNPTRNKKQYLREEAKRLEVLRQAYKKLNIDPDLAC